MKDVASQALNLRRYSTTSDEKHLLETTLGLLVDRELSFNQFYKLLQSETHEKVSKKDASQALLDLSKKGLVFQYFKNTSPDTVYYSLSSLGKDYATKRKISTAKRRAKAS